MSEATSKPKNPQALGGMTLRDYFAGQAIDGIISHPESPAPDWGMCAEAAYKVADAMLEERSK